METIEDKLKTSNNKASFWDNVFLDNLQTIDIIKYLRIYSHIKNEPEKGVHELKEFFENRRGIRKHVADYLLISKLINRIEAWEQYYKEYGNWYDASSDIIKDFKINLKIKGLENLKEINENESVLYLMPHNHELEGLFAFAAIGVFFYEKEQKERVKAIANYLTKGIENFDKSVFFIKNTSHKGKRRGFNKKVFTNDINPYLKSGGHVIHFLSGTNPYWFFGTQHGKLYSSSAKCAEHADKVVPLYVDFPEGSFISKIRKVRNIFRLRDLFDKEGLTCTFHIDEGFNPKTDAGYLEAKGPIKKAEYIRDRCFGLKEKYKDKESINLRDLKQYVQHLQHQKV